jgi:hypothetical protein
MVDSEFIFEGGNARRRSEAVPALYFMVRGVTPNREIELFYFGMEKVEDRAKLINKEGV